MVAKVNTKRVKTSHLSKVGIKCLKKKGGGYKKN